MPRPGDASRDAKSATLNSFEAATFPTWTFWGKTNAHFYNTGNCEVTVSYQAGAAAPIYVALDEGKDNATFGYWAGFPLTVANVSQRDDAHNVEPQVEVWVW